MVTCWPVGEEQRRTMHIRTKMYFKNAWKMEVGWGWKNRQTLVDVITNCPANCLCLTKLFVSLKLQWKKIYKQLYVLVINSASFCNFWFNLSSNVQLKLSDKHVYIIFCDDLGYKAMYAWVNLIEIEYRNDIDLEVISEMEFLWI